MELDYSESIVDKILFQPIKAGANRLCISAKYASPSMAAWLLKTYEERNMVGISVELIVDSIVNGGIDYIAHEGFKKLQQEYNSTEKENFKCSYLYKPPILSDNCFIWLYGDKPIQAFNCSYDFTQASFLKSPQGYYHSINANYAYNLFRKMIDRTIYCNHFEVDCEVIISSSSKTQQFSSNNYESCKLSLITKQTGEPGKKSGLNWGQRNKRNRNEAYIPLPSQVARSGFFPLNKQHFLVVTDDHHTLLLRVEQQNDKAITTPSNNALLGEYFRNRLDLPNGAFVKTQDLIAYGRTDVTFYKIDDEQYFMDFSVESRGNGNGG